MFFRTMTTITVLILMFGCGDNDEKKSINPITQSDFETLQTSVDNLAAQVAALKGGKPSTEQPPSVVTVTNTPKDPISQDGTFTLNPNKPHTPSDNTQVVHIIQPPKPPPKLQGVIAFSSDGEIFTMKPNGSGKKNLTLHNAIDIDPVWSPDGSKIAFLSTRDGNAFGLFVMQADGSNQRQVTDWAGGGDLQGAFRPVWSPHGAHIHIAGLNTRTPEWSPDFSHIVYVDQTNSDYPFLTIVDANTTQIVHITDVPSYRPAWSPDGQKIAYQVNQGGDDWDIYAVNSDGSNPINLTRHEGNDQFPTWSLMASISLLPRSVPLTLTGKSM